MTALLAAFLVGVAVGAVLMGMLALASERHR
jgi:hypothetical protein